jgi:hypothetical protein
MEHIIPTGYVHGLLTRKDKSSFEFVGNNLVVAAGKNFMASRMNGNSPAAMSHMAIGDDITAAAETQTTLVGTEIERVAGSNTVTDNVFTMSATFGTAIVTETTIGEIGIFNASSAGTMLARFTTPEFTMDAGDSLTITWSIQFGA